MRLKDFENDDSGVTWYDETDELINRKKPNLIILYVLLLFAVITFGGYRWQHIHNEGIYADRCLIYQGKVYDKQVAYQESVKYTQEAEIEDFKIENSWLFGAPQVLYVTAWASNGCDSLNTWYSASSISDSIIISNSAWRTMSAIERR